MAEKTIVILGAGVGGIVTARELRRHLGNRHRIILVDRSDTHSFSPSFLWVMVGWRRPAAVQKSLGLLEKYGIEFHNAFVRAIDLDKCAVETQLGQLPYDYLVVALGTDLVPERIPGLPGASYTNYTLAGSLELCSALPTLSGGTVAVVVSRLPYKCPPAPYETALLLRAYFNRRSLPDVAVKVFTPELLPLQAAGPAAGHALAELLRQRSIELYCDHSLARVQGTTKELTFERDITVPYNLLVAIPPHEAPAVVRDAGLVDVSGWISVDASTMRTQHANVYAIGDVTTIPLPSGMALPKTGVFAHDQAEVVAHNIATEILNSGLKKKFLGLGYCFIETGDGKAAYFHGDFFAEPSPLITQHEPSVTYHWGKVLFEKYWLWRWF